MFDWSCSIQRICFNNIHLQHWSSSRRICLVNISNEVSGKPKTHSMFVRSMSYKKYVNISSIYVRYQNKKKCQNFKFRSLNILFEKVSNPNVTLKRLFQFKLARHLVQQFQSLRFVVKKLSQIAGIKITLLSFI